MDKNVMIEMIEHELFTATKSLSVALKLFEEVKKCDLPAVEQKCKHPQNMRIDLTTMGSERRFYCKECDEEVIVGG